MNLWVRQLVLGLFALQSFLQNQIVHSINLFLLRQLRFLRCCCQPKLLPLVQKLKVLIPKLQIFFDYLNQPPCFPLVWHILRLLRCSFFSLFFCLKADFFVFLILFQILLRHELIFLLLFLFFVQGVLCLLLNQK